MKTKTSAWIRAGWRALTEVPGWPDAPVWPRMQRAMPVLIPCTGMVMLLDWGLLFQAPAIREQQLALAPLVSLERDVSVLRLSGSESQLSEVTNRAAIARELALDTAAALPNLLREFKNQAATAGWDAQFVAADIESEVPKPGALVGYLPVRAKLTPVSSNPDVFGSFVGLIEGISSSKKRIDLIRLSVRADEHRWQVVELNLRCVYPLNNAKTSQ